VIPKASYQFAGPAVYAKAGLHTLRLCVRSCTAHTQSKPKAPTCWIEDSDVVAMNREPRSFSKGRAEDENMGSVDERHAA